MAYVWRGNIGLRRHAFAALSSGYSSKVLGYSPIAYWPLWETSGPTAQCLVNAAQNGTYAGVTLADTAGPDGNLCPFFDGANDYVNIYTAPFDTAFNGAEGTVALWVKVFNVGVWTDGSQRRGIYLAVDANNYISIFRSTVNNELAWFYKAGGTFEVNTVSTSDTAWMHVAITWSKTADEVRYYRNGASAGSTDTGLGVWAGNFNPSWATIGAGSTGPIHPWYGWLAHCAVWDSALTPTQIADLAAV